MRRALLHLKSESLKVWPERLTWPCLRGFNNPRNLGSYVTNMMYLMISRFSILDYGTVVQPQ